MGMPFIIVAKYRDSTSIHFLQVDSRSATIADLFALASSSFFSGYILKADTVVIEIHKDP